MGSAYELRADQNVTIPRYEGFPNTEPLDAFYSTDGAPRTESDGGFHRPGISGLFGWTYFAYDPGYRDIQLNFVVEESNTTALRVTLRSQDSQPIVLLVAAGPPDDAHTLGTLTLTLSAGSTLLSTVVYNSDTSDGTYTIEAIGPVVIVGFSDAYGFGGTSITAAMPADIQNQRGTHFSIEATAGSSSGGTNLTYVDMDYPSATVVTATASAVRQARNETGEGNRRLHGKRQVRIGHAKAAPRLQAHRQIRHGRMIGNGPGGSYSGPFPPMADNTINGSGEGVREDRYGSGALTHVATTTDHGHPTAMRQARTGSGTATSVVVTPVGATGASTRQPRSEAANALVRDLTLVHLAGVVSQPQFDESEGLVVLQELTGHCIQAAAVSGSLSFPQALAGVIVQRDALRALEGSVGTQIVPTAGGHLVLNTRVTQKAALRALLTVRDSTGIVVSGTSINTIGSRLDPTFPGIGNLRANEYDIRDGEHDAHKPGFSPKRTYERAPTFTQEKVWDFPGNPAVGVHSTPYRTLRHAGTVTELAFSCSQVATAGQLLLDLLQNGVVVGTLPVPTAEFTWSLPLDIVYTYGDVFTVRLRGGVAVIHHAGSANNGAGYDETMVTTEFTGLMDVAVHAYFKQTAWTRGRAYAS